MRVWTERTVIRITVEVARTLTPDVGAGKDFFQKSLKVLPTETKIARTRGGHAGRMSVFSRFGCYLPPVGIGQDPWGTYLPIFLSDRRKF